MDTAVLVLRTVLSLAAVLGLIWYAGRRLNDSANGQRGDGKLARLLGGTAMGGRGSRGQRTPAVRLTVVGRQVLGPKASLAVVDVGDERLVLGVTEGGVSVLSTQEIPPVEAFADELAAARSEIREEIDVPVLAKPVLVTSAPRTSALDSSILSPTTWRQTLSLLQGRTVRR